MKLVDREDFKIVNNGMTACMCVILNMNLLKFVFAYIYYFMNVSDPNWYMYYYLVTSPNWI